MDKFTRQFFRQHGFSLIEILAALALGVLMMTSLVSMVDVTLQDTKGQQTAQYQSQFAAAAARYLNDNVTTLQPMVAAGATASVNLTTLQPLYLPSTFATVNAYRQAPCMLVRASATANQLDALIVTEGGDPIPPKDIGYIAANAGTGGGSIRLKNLDIPNSPIIAEGAYGAWELDTTQLQNFTATKCSLNFASIGNMATLLAYGGPNAINRNVLFRNPTPSDPTLNQMNIPLGFTAGATGAPGGMRVVGEACSSPGITLDSTNGNILQCNTVNGVGTGKWEPAASKFWKDPVDTFTALPPTAADGEVRMTKDTHRGFMFKVATNQWLPLAEDQYGDLKVTRTINAGRDINAIGNIIAKGAIVGDSITTGTKIAGAQCNIQSIDFYGNPIIILSFGTLVTGAHGRVMECVQLAPTDTTGFLYYVDGTSTTQP